MLRDSASSEPAQRKPWQAPELAQFAVEDMFGSYGPQPPWGAIGVTAFESFASGPVGPVSGWGPSLGDGPVGPVVSLGPSVANGPGVRK